MEEPTLFNLKGDGVTITYSTSGVVGRPTFQYRDKTFRPDEITIEDSALGRMVSVVLERVPDLKTVSLTLLVPTVALDPPKERSATIQTFAIESERADSIAPATLHGQLQTYRVRRLRGTAEFVVF
jgi:hypothetical protein